MEAFDVSRYVEMEGRGGTLREVVERTEGEQVQEAAKSTDKMLGTARYKKAQGAFSSRL
jgi:hypothetical protein